MDLTTLGEFGLIAQIKKAFPETNEFTGIGDDCAILPQSDNLETLVSTDMLIEGTHFLKEDINPYQLGWKSAAVNISDIAAMGGKPVATFLSVALPKDTERNWIDEFIRGYKDISLRYDTVLLGGDTTQSPDRICINVCVIGQCQKGTAKLRKDACIGDAICVTGPLGDSAAGLRLILEGLKDDQEAEELIEKHYLPHPRVEEGLRLGANPKVHAMMDISDGVASDLRHILDACGHGAEIALRSLPLSAALRRLCERRGWPADQLALCGGEDYELLFTIDSEAETQLDVPHYVIGHITAAPGLRWISDSDSKDLDFIGFRHLGT